MLKNSLRKTYKQKRISLSEEEKNNLQNNIYQQLFKLDFTAVKTIHLFLSMDKFNEINTQPIIDFFRSIDKQIAVSVCDFSNNTLKHYLLTENTQLSVNKFGVPEPVNATKITPQELDIIFVPMLISDKKNYRVGYGKGFYDRFLAECRADCKTIGLNFFKPIEKITDTHQFDVPLDIVIYPK